jgi:cell wall-associated NlpC family hydrolase
LAIAFQYEPDASNLALNGLRIAGDAAYGASAGADFNDYLGVDWQYGASADQSEPAELGKLDCSGFIRMVLGYRLGIPMSISAAPGTLPRRAAVQFSAGRGRVIVSNTGRQVTSLGRLRPGDLAFFDASTRNGTVIDHVGIFVG